ncbi:hypothetical protein CTI12_AA386130 [Artemisia annua]|uniref:Uncharacterized protein n=1 Tax=Artemisia annua TaxID=35608 RepID=A0A2U1MFP6_ARTAN|nr:hypothetical protein CTI12_AA386130 [Artemisia annua]
MTSLPSGIDNLTLLDGLRLGQFWKELDCFPSLKRDREAEEQPLVYFFVWLEPLGDNSGRRKTPHLTGGVMDMGIWYKRNSNLVNQYAIYQRYQFLFVPWARRSLCFEGSTKGSKVCLFRRPRVTVNFH